MAGAATPGRKIVLETDRLLLRPWRVSEAAIQRELWTERDPPDAVRLWGFRILGIPMLVLLLVVAPVMQSVQTHRTWRSVS